MTKESEELKNVPDCTYPSIEEVCEGLWEDVEIDNSHQPEIDLIEKSLTSSCENMKTADELFEELGYSLVQTLLDRDRIVYQIDQIPGTSVDEITFWLSDKGYCKELVDVNNDCMTPMAQEIRIEEHLAITQKMRELGWIK